MATLDLKITSAAGVSTQTLTFSGPDATRIIQAYQKNIKAGGTQDDFLTWLTPMVRGNIIALVRSAETVTPDAPTLT